MITPTKYQPTINQRSGPKRNVSTAFRPNFSIIQPNQPLLSPAGKPQSVPDKPITMPHQQRIAACPLWPITDSVWRVPCVSYPIEVMSAAFSATSLPKDYENQSTYSHCIPASKRLYIFNQRIECRHHNFPVDGISAIHRSKHITAISLQFFKCTPVTLAKFRAG